LETNRIHILNQRKELLEEVQIYIKEEDEEKKKNSNKQIEKLIDQLMNPQKIDITEQGDATSDIDKFYNIEELDDCVIVEEKDFKEYVDDTGVVVIEEK